MLGQRKPPSIRGRVVLTVSSGASPPLRVSLDSFGRGAVDAADTEDTQCDLGVFADDFTFVSTGLHDFAAAISSGVGCLGTAVLSYSSVIPRTHVPVSVLVLIWIVVFVHVAIVLPFLSLKLAKVPVLSVT